MRFFFVLIGANSFSDRVHDVDNRILNILLPKFIWQKKINNDGRVILLITVFINAIFGMIVFQPTQGAKVHIFEAPALKNCAYSMLINTVYYYLFLLYIVFFLF